MTWKPDDVLHIRVSSREKDSYREAATRADMTLTTWVRDRLRMATLRDRRAARREFTDDFKREIEDRL